MSRIQRFNWELDGRPRDNCPYEYYYPYNNGTYVCAAYDARAGEFYNPAARNHNTQPPPEQVLFVLLLLVSAFVLVVFRAILGRWPWDNAPDESLPSVPAIPDYSDEIRYWQNEKRRIEAELAARAKQAEQEEFERWLEERRYGQRD